MKARTRHRPRKRLGAIVEIVLWLVSAVTLGSAVWMKADALVYQQVSRSAIEARPVAARAVVPIGTPIAKLSIPELGFSAIVAEGSTSEVLRRAVGRIRSGAQPGEQGNVVLAGHRDTFFRSLQDVHLGDEIILESARERHTYHVVWVKIVDPSDLSVLEPHRGRELTLVTCFPFRYVGNAPKRFIVRARVADEP